MNFNPHDYQKTAIEFIKTHDRCALFLDMGLGKTVSTLTALNDLENDYKMAKVKTANPISPSKGKSVFTFSMLGDSSKTCGTYYLDGRGSEVGPFKAP